MIVPLAQLLERYFGLPSERMIPLVSRLAVLLAASAFLSLATLIIAFDYIFPGQLAGAQLAIGSVAESDIYAPESTTYISQVLTDQRRNDAQATVRPVYNSPDPSVARTQTRLAGQILDYIDNVRRDPYATDEQRFADIRQITALTLDESTATLLSSLDDETWNDVRNEVIRLLEQVMQESIRDVDLQATRERLPVQVGLRFEDAQIAGIVAIVEDLIRPNTSEDAEATERARQTAAESVPDELRTFQRGQIVVRGGGQIGTLEYEALDQLGLLQPPDRRIQQIGRSLIAVIVVAALLGMYIARFRRSLFYSEPRLLVLLAIIFLMTLLGVRLSLGNQIYLFPAAVLSLLYVAIVSPHISIIGTIGLALLSGIMANNSLEVATLIMTSGIIGALSLRRAERLNPYFVTGLLIALINMTVAAIFNLVTPVGINIAGLPVLLIYSALNGVLTAAATMIGLYIIGLIFNLPTALKLIELSQPSQPLLQRLLREAPGTYQHSLQVANLGEQAANAIGANAVLVHVSALYHDIGKMLNPAFFTENQRDIGNPHDALNDPHRSADIIISHVTEGDEMARQHRLPRRIRDFIREHHGTSKVFVFYQQALARVGDDPSALDASDFTYPGPRPQSRETAILMLADSCEAAIRSMQPGSKQEIEEAVDRIIEGKRREGQLDDSNLTLNDLSIIKRIFVDILKASFHPRINYTEAIAKARGAVATPTPHTTPKVPAKPEDHRIATITENAVATVKLPPQEKTDIDDDEDTPLPYVPKLTRTGTNGKGKEHQETQEAQALDLVDHEAATSAENNPESIESEPHDDPKP